MNISDRLRENFVFSAAGVVPFRPTEAHRRFLDHDVNYTSDARTELGDLAKPTAAEGLFHSINTVSETPFWRVDGSIFGTTFFATPVFQLPDIPPTRIDVLIPDQLDWAPELWGTLGASDSVHMHDQRVADLGISRYLVRVLDNWSRDYSEFEEMYRGLPFGSSIVFDKIGLNLSEINIKVVRNTEFPKHLLSVNSLRTMWDIRAKDMPRQINILELRFIKRLYSSVCLVEHNDKRLVFKSNSQSPSSIYHEIKVLLTIPPHPNIIGPPTALVTMCNDVPEAAAPVCGFLLEYYELGSMEAFLPRSLSSRSLCLQDQVRWSLQLASALEHIHSQPGMFYSDLKMDNILMRPVNGKVSIVLMDFEQSRNLYTWAPPEVFYVEWITELGFRDLARNDSLADETMAEFRSLIEQYFTSRGTALPLRFKQVDYDNPDHGWYYPWLTSTPEEREAGAVYCLGRALWCIFEGVGDTSNVLGRSLPHDSDSELEFPSFTRRTPNLVQDLIKICTSGAREWTDGGPLGLFRRQGKVYPRGRTGVSGEPLATVEETRQAIRNVWEREIATAKAFLLAREKLFQGKEDADDLKLLGYLQRPALKDVLIFFEKFQTHEMNGLGKRCCVS